MQNDIFICAKETKRGNRCIFLVIVAADVFEAEKKMLEGGPRPENWTIEPITSEQVRKLIKDLRESLDVLK